MDKKENKKTALLFEILKIRDMKDEEMMSTFKECLSLDGDINDYKDGSKNTVLHTLCSHLRFDLIKILVDLEPDLKFNIENDYGNTPFDNLIIAFELKNKLEDKYEVYKIIQFYLEHAFKEENVSRKEMKVRNTIQNEMLKSIQDEISTCKRKINYFETDLKSVIDRIIDLEVDENFNKDEKQGGQS